MPGLPESGHLCVISRVLEKDKAGDNEFTHLSKYRDWDNPVLVRILVEDINLGYL